MKTINEIIKSEIEKVKSKFKNEKSFLGYAHSIHVLEDIPRSKLDGALKACGLEDLRDETYLLIDNTFLGGAEDCVLFIDEFLVVRNDLLTEYEDKQICFSWSIIRNVTYNKLKQFVLTIFVEDENRLYDIPIPESYFILIIDNENYLRKNLIQLISDIGKEIELNRPILIEVENSLGQGADISPTINSIVNVTSFQGISSDNSNSREELNYLIDRALINGELSEKEIQVIMKKAVTLGLDPDEIEIELEAKSFELSKGKTDLLPTPSTASVSEINIIQNPEPKCIKRSVISKLFTKGHDLDEGYAVALQLLNTKGNKMNSAIPKDILKHYLFPEMDKKDIEKAVNKSFSDIFCKFSKKHAFQMAVELLKTKPNINPKKDQRELLNNIYDGITYDEIISITENCYRNYYSLYSPVEALEIAIPFIKKLGDIDPKMNFNPNIPKQRNENEEQLKTFFEQSMTVANIKNSCVRAFETEFGKKGNSWFGDNKPKITNPEYAIPEAPNELKVIFYNSFGKIANSIADSTPTLINMALGKII